jgi:uncharacterized protein YjbJ (UPF0337 family)
MEEKKNQSNQAFKVNGNWEAQSKQLKSKFSQLTDEDLKIEQGKEHEMIGRVENRLKKSREEVIDIINQNQPK